MEQLAKDQVQANFEVGERLEVEHQIERSRGENGEYFGDGGH
jgi:hypothetical protein